MPSAFFFFNDTATTEIYTLSLHDALPISTRCCTSNIRPENRAAACCHILRNSARKKNCFRNLTGRGRRWISWREEERGDRKSTRLNSSHTVISYAVFCLKKKITH